MTRRLSGLSVLVAGVLLVGCGEPIVHDVGHTEPLRAVYSNGTLSCRLPAGVPVESAVVAGEQTLERSGHSISAREATSYRGRVVGRPGATRLYKKATITSHRVNSGNRVEIEVEPFGDEPTSRAVLDEMLLRLGL